MTVKKAQYLVLNRTMLC